MSYSAAFLLRSSLPSHKPRSVPSRVSFLSLSTKLLVRVHSFSISVKPPVRVVPTGQQRDSILVHSLDLVFLHGQLTEA
jgi:hypothetical protein